MPGKLRRMSGVDPWQAVSDVLEQGIRDGVFPGPEHSFGRKKAPRAVAKLY